MAMMLMMISSSEFQKSRWWLMLPVVALASVVVASCYTFTLIEMPHELIAGETFSGKVVVKIKEE